MVSQFLGFEEITYMQEMNASVCANADIGETKQLIDTRDSKTYWVAKLKDGNCWMTQNLALDLNTSRPLTSLDSDVASNWTPAANTQSGTITKFPSSSDRTLSYNPGKLVYTTPTEQNSCGTTGITKLEGCKNWTNVANMMPSNNPNQSSPLLNSIYDAHYLSGNYYSYEVATAGYTKDSGSAPNSVCPKGWQLPPSSGNKSFSTLLTSYGASSGILYGTQDIRLSPLYFVYGGYVYSSSLRYAGSNGYYWSSTASSASSAYYLNFSTSVAPSTSSLARYLGFSVRCVAR